MEAPALGPGLVERLEQLATCPLCGGPFEDPVLLACEHSFCRACLARRWGTPPASGPEASPPACPRCGLPCPRRSLRSNVRLAVEVRISRGLREKLAAPGARAGRRRGGRIPTMGSLDPLGEDMRKTWRRSDAPTPKSSTSEDDLPEDYPVVKNMLHRLTADLTLDPSTAHRRLLISSDRRSVQLAPPGTPEPPDSPARFDQLPAVLGAQGFGAGRHCWEVETVGTASCRDPGGEDEDMESHYALGAAGESVQRKGRAPGPLGQRVFPLLCTRDPRAPLRIVPAEG
ncbi:RING finger protein 39 isoform X2 [Molossus molossus]|uniref:RING finger protein 39 isoform X2 n=1 Tax=Molossus molossus TaxID=27622 RepID=UPI001746ED90|nr:RING finger protein 39 isoform X2 [Molossus molossus]